MADNFINFQTLLENNVNYIITEAIMDAGWERLAEPVFDAFIKEAYENATKEGRSHVGFEADKPEDEIEARGWFWLSEDHPIPMPEQKLSDVFLREIEDGNITRENIDVTVRKVYAVLDRKLKEQQT